MSRLLALAIACLSMLACAGSGDDTFTSTGSDELTTSWSGNVTLPSGYVVRADEVVVLDPNAATTVEARGNIIVYGRLVSRPTSANVVHTIRFTGIDESAFVGGGLDPMPSDVGLWVMGAGVVDIQGAPKLGWARATGGLAAGARTLTLDADPIGWRAGDEVVIAPTEPPTVFRQHEHFDVRTIASLSGRTITLSAGTTYPHPSVAVGRGITMTAEVANLTRNVRIEGTAGGRSHVFMRSLAPQTVRYAALRYLGPRHDDGTAVLGRWGLHFHHAHGGSRGSLVEGVVSREFGTNAFVPHMSDGITFRDCVAYDIGDSAYWWDIPDETRDTLFDHCLAARVTAGTSPTGFQLGQSTGNAIHDSVSVGVAGSHQTAAGFWWNQGVPPWGFEDNVSHNNQHLGIYDWSNSAANPAHVISHFIAYHNGRYGILHGAYRNTHQFVDTILYGNLRGALQVHISPSGPDAAIVYQDGCLFDAAGMSDYAVASSGHSVAPGLPPYRFAHSEFRGHRVAGFALTESSRYPDFYEMGPGNTFTGNPFWLASNIHPDSVIQVRDPGGLGSFDLRRASTPGGVFVPAWNAKRFNR